VRSCVCHSRLKESCIRTRNILQYTYLSHYSTHILQPFRVYSVRPSEVKVIMKYTVFILSAVLVFSIVQQVSEAASSTSTTSSTISSSTSMATGSSTPTTANTNAATALQVSSCLLTLCVALIASRLVWVKYPPLSVFLIMWAPSTIFQTTADSAWRMRGVYGKMHNCTSSPPHPLSQSNWNIQIPRFFFI